MPRQWQGRNQNQQQWGKGGGGSREVYAEPQPQPASTGGYYSGKGSDGPGAGGGRGKASAEASKLPGGLVRKLNALGYPEIDQISLSGPSYCKVILWLEEEKIRLYAKNDRRVLRDFNKAWYEHVQTYCKDLDVEAEGLHESNTKVKLKVLNALTGLAVLDVYRDHMEAEQLSIVPQSKPHLSADERNRKLEDMMLPLNKLLGCFNLPQLPHDSGDATIIAGLKCIHARICPPRKGDSHQTLDINKLPVAVAVDDPELKRAAVILRMLHGIELRGLQVNINTVINELQQLTADPKTDARLGRVGR